MKYKKHSSIIIMAAFTLAVIFLCAAAAFDPQVRQPKMDEQGRFWIYRNGPLQPHMPFSPYGWMSDATNVTQLIHVDLDCADHPNTALTAANTSEKEQCIRIKINWDDATWVSVAFISGSDKPPWWADTPGGRYYNLSALVKKKLVFYARGEHGGESIKAQIGIFGGKPYGDSLSKPIVSEEIKLTTEWTRHEIDLKDVPLSELSHVCNGFGVIAEEISQPGSPTQTQFYLDDIYYE